MPVIVEDPVPFVAALIVAGVAAIGCYVVHGIQRCLHRPKEPPAPRLPMIDKLSPKIRASVCTAEERQEPCPICLCDLADDDAAPHVELRKLLCGHLYHAKCIDGWIDKGGLCCICRSSPLETPTTCAVATNNASELNAAEEPTVPADLEVGVSAVPVSIIGRSTSEGRTTQESDSDAPGNVLQYSVPAPAAGPCSSLDADTNGMVESCSMTKPGGQSHEGGVVATPNTSSNEAVLPPVPEDNMENGFWDLHDSARDLTPMFVPGIADHSIGNSKPIKMELGARDVDDNSLDGDGYSAPLAFADRQQTPLYTSL